MNTLWQSFLDKAVYSYQYSTPFYVQLLLHIFVILPLMIFCFYAAVKICHLPQPKKERWLRFGAIVLIVMYIIGVLYRSIEEERFIESFSFEISQLSALYLIFAVFVVKKRFWYVGAYIIGMLSFLSVYLVPYLIVGIYPFYHFTVLISLIYHFFNGFCALLLLSVRGLRLQKKDMIGMLIWSFVTFVIVYGMALILRGNYFLVLDHEGLPVISILDAPYHNIISFSLVLFFNTLIIFLTMAVFHLHKIGVFAKIKNKIMVRQNK